jgi:hypothetical protein
MPDLLQIHSQKHHLETHEGPTWWLASGPVQPLQQDVQKSIKFQRTFESQSQDLSVLIMFRKLSIKYMHSVLDPNKVQCEVCYKYIHKNTISRHLKNQHGDAPHVQCPHCSKLQKNAYSLKDHMRTIHGVYQN